MLLLYLLSFFKNVI